MEPCRSQRALPKRREELRETILKFFEEAELDDCLPQVHAELATWAW